MSQYIQLLRNRRGFRNLWLASVVSLAGDWFNTIASLIIVNRYTDSGLAVSWILLARLLPIFFVGPLAGVVADRFNRKHIMVLSDLLRAGIVLSFLFVNSAERIWLIYLLTGLQFIVSSFFEPAYNAIAPSLVEGDAELLTANVLGSITWSAMLALGAAIGGVFANFFGAEMALIADSLSYLVSAVFLFYIPFVPTAVPEASSDEARGLARGWRDFVDGIAYVVSRPFMLVIVLVKAFGQIGNGDIIIATYAERFFPFGKEGSLAVGVMYAASGLGAVLGPLVANHWVKENQPALRRAILLGFILVPFGWLLVGLGRLLPLVSFGFLLRAIGTSINWTYSSVLIQLRAPDNFLGRIFALDLALFTVFSAFSIWLSGYLMDQYAIDPRTLSAGFGWVSVLPIFLWLGVLQYSRRNTSQTD